MARQRYRKRYPPNVTCSTCLVRAGSWCKTSNGNESHTSHRARMNLVAELQEKELKRIARAERAALYEDAARLFENDPVVQMLLRKAGEIDGGSR